MLIALVSEESTKGAAPCLSRRKIWAIRGEIIADIWYGHLSARPASQLNR